MPGPLADQDVVGDLIGLRVDDGDPVSRP